MARSKDQAEQLEFEVRFFEDAYRLDRKDKQVIERLGHLYTQIGRIDEGLLMDQHLVRLDPKNPLAHYNFACSLSLKKRFPEAVEHLRMAFILGYDDVHHMLRDPDLKNLSKYPGYHNLLRNLGIVK